MSTAVVANTEIELASGAMLDVLHPQPVMTLGDVAQGLSNCCRFAGQSNRFYSVAEHACVVADKLRQEKRSHRLILLGLHHDDSEAFLGDVTRPLKPLLARYRELEDRMTAVIGQALNLPVAASTTELEIVKAADEWALAQEAHALMPSKGSTWFCADQVMPHWLASQLPIGLSSEQAYWTWLYFHAQYDA
jgi:hypothetical protein